MYQPAKADQSHTSSLGRCSVRIPDFFKQTCCPTELVEAYQDNMKIAVSELIVKYLERLGTDYIFGMSGAHILPVYDSLYDSEVKIVLVKHEQGAAFIIPYNMQKELADACNFAGNLFNR